MRPKNLFGLDGTKTFLILILSALFCAAMAYKIAVTNDEESWQIVKDGVYYLTHDPLEQDGCVYFTDESGLARKVCGKYKLTRI